jgi:hypothetical protein
VGVGVAGSEKWALQLVRGTKDLDGRLMTGMAAGAMTSSKCGLLLRRPSGVMVAVGAVGAGAVEQRWGGAAKMGAWEGLV